MVEIENTFGKEIESLWDKYKDTHEIFRERGFALPDKVKKDGVLFVGINPSYTGNNGSHFYPQHKESGTSHSYFAKFPKLSDDWTHLDLLFVRETDQGTVGKLLSKNVDFFYKQLLLSKEIIESAKPKVIVVNNTLSRHLLGYHQNEEQTKDVWIGYKFKFDDELGTEVIQNGVLKGTPVFFTSMLTGQRALDIGSYERLKWHINFVLNKTGKLKTE